MVKLLIVTSVVAMAEFITDVLVDVLRMFRFPGFSFFFLILALGAFENWRTSAAVTWIFVTNLLLHL